MKQTLRPGLEHEFRYLVPANKTVPHLYPEAADFQSMPAVFATGYMVGLLEWACLDALKPHLDAGEQSVGIDIRVSHLAATPPGLTVTVRVTLDRVEGRKLTFSLSAHDGVDTISRGTHQRFVIHPARFLAKLDEKRVAARGGSAAGGQ